MTIADASTAVDQLADRFWQGFLERQPIVATIYETTVGTIGCRTSERLAGPRRRPRAATCCARRSR
ncbi:MAG: hypothetical protein ABR509_04815 [Candidatus Limnocylindria bacterium]